MATDAPAVLSRIVDARRRAIESAKAALPADAVRQMAAAGPRPRDFRAALHKDGVALIAECKQRSPSGGLLQPDYNPARLARRFAAAGAAALSVLTEPEFFGGKPEDLAAVRGAVGLPILCKDFIIDPYQIWQARAMGADAVLLIVGILPGATLDELGYAVEEQGLQAVVEVHTEEELARALGSGAQIIGINNRDLQTLQTDVEVTARLRPRIPPGPTVISESGISSRRDVERLTRLGVDAVLVGEALLKAPDLEAQVRELLVT